MERIQYVRGPASVLYGDGSPGALVNLVLKKPLPIRRVELSGSGGNGFGRVAADATGPLNAARSARYRLIASGEWLDNGFDNGERRFTVFLSLAIDLGPRSLLSFDTEVYRQRGRNYRHVVPATELTQHGDFSQYPWDLSVASPDDGWSGGNASPGARLDFRLGPDSAIHFSGRYTRIDGDIDIQALYGVSDEGGTALRYHYREISTWDEYQTDTFASTVVLTGSIEHRLVGGIEAGVSTTDSQIGVGPATPLDIHDPDHGPPPLEPALAPTRFDIVRVGFYASDQVRLSDVVTVVPAVRWSRIDIDDKVAAATAAGAAASAGDSIVSPSVGLVVLPRPWFSLDANDAQGFEPPAPGQYLEGGLAPALSENWSIESGAKAEVMGRRPRGFYRQIGEGESHGLELEAVGLIAPRVTTRAGYAWTDTEITRDAMETAGRELPNAPRHKANLWLRYRFDSVAVRGLMVSAGVVHESDRFTDRANSVVAPAYTRADASLSWPLSDRLRLGAVAENLTDRRYVRSGAGGVLFAGPPRRLAVRVMSSF